MARQISFGEVLRDARIRRGMDINTAAHRLRIRADILVAIEECDFARMPARGYSKSMIGAYARLVGLNPGEITRMYLDEVYAFEVGRVRTSDRPAPRAASSRAQGGAYADSSRGRAGGSQQGRSGSRSARDGGERAALGTRERYSDRPERPGRTHPQERVHSSRTRSLPTSTSHYTNLVAAPKNIAQPSKRPFLIAGAVVLALLVILVVFVFGGKEKEATQDVPTVPVSGLTDTSNLVPEESATSTVPVAPTKAVFAYKVADDKEAYIEVYVDGADSPSVAKTVAGPASSSYDVTETLKFVTTAPESVTVTVDGETIELTDDNSDGVYIYTLDFASILAAWQAENATAADDSAGVSDESQQDAASGDTAS